MDDGIRSEQEEIARSQAPGEALSWEDLVRMRYTWAAAMETLRMVPPVFSMMRKSVADVEYGGYLIPEGWQVIHAANMTQWDPAIFPEPGRFDPARFENPSGCRPSPSCRSAAARASAPGTSSPGWRRWWPCTTS